MVQTTEEHIVKKLKNRGTGYIFTPDDFTGSYSNTNVRQSLHRLENDNVVVRLAHGIYLYPKEDPQLGVLKPTIDQIAKAIAKRDRAKIVPTGILALNKLGLSTQVPLNAVYLTDGSPRIIRIGNRKIKFKRTVPKNLKAKGEISSLVIQALKEIGKGNVTAQQKKKINELLEKEKPGYLKHDIKLAPVWIREIMEQSMK